MCSYLIQSLQLGGGVHELALTCETWGGGSVSTELLGLRVRVGWAPEGNWGLFLEVGSEFWVTPSHHMLVTGTVTCGVSGTWGQGSKEAQAWWPVFRTEQTVRCRDGHGQALSPAFCAFNSTV